MGTMDSQVTTTAGPKKTSIILTGGKKKSIVFNQRPSTSIHGSRKSIILNQRPSTVMNPSSDNIDRGLAALTANKRSSKFGVNGISQNQRLSMLGRLGSPMLGRLGSPTDRWLLLPYCIPHSSHKMISPFIILIAW
jgi:hypothetical protein